MADLKMRPRFSIDVPCGAAAVVEALRERIGETDPPLEGHFDVARCALRIPAERRSFWSPELDVTFEPVEGAGGAPGGVRVRCMFAPRPSVWTGFAFVYAMLALCGLSGGLFGLVQLSLGSPPWGLAVPAAALVLIAGVYGASFAGQGLAAGQMYQLRRYLDDSLERAAERARAAPPTPLDSAQL